MGERVPYKPWSRVEAALGALAAAQAELAAAVAEVKGKRSEHHGTVGTYKRGCRCGQCREGWRLYYAERRAIRRAAAGQDAGSEQTTAT